ncbi:MAG: rhodanese-like domain-containing protein, partial [Candidatus Bathyarchaeota archaeon]
HIEGALHIYVGLLENRISEVSREKPIAVICGAGHRSGLAASILLRSGFEKVFNVWGGMSAWKACNYPMTK